jgi:hypothetical protein
MVSFRMVAVACLVVATLCCVARAGPLPAKEAAAPPLPFSYIGKVTQDGRTTVFLSRDQFSYAARVGENLDSEYRVDAIEENRVVLTYLPLGTQRVLPFAATPESLALNFNAPQQASVDQEFPISLAVQGAAQGATVTVVLSYDPALLSPVDDDGTPGRMAVRLNAGGDKPTLVQFQVTGTAPAVTKIDISTQAADANGRALDIRGPNAHTLRIIP